MQENSLQIKKHQMGRLEKSTHTDLLVCSHLYRYQYQYVFVKGHIPSLFSISGIRIWTSYSKCSKGLPPAELDIDLPSPLMKIPSLFVLPQCPLTPHPLHPIYFFNFLQLGKQLCWLGPQPISNFKMLTSKSE